MTRSVDSGVILIASLLLAALFVWGASTKAAGLAEFTTSLRNLYVPYAHVVAPAAAAIEGLGGLLLVVGYRVKPVAVLLALYTLLLAVIGYNFWDASTPAVHYEMVLHFWKNVAIAGGFLLLSVTGAGAVSIDAMRRPASILPRA